MKERLPPLTLLTLDACIARVVDGHPLLGVLRKNAAIYQKGYNGERKLDFHLKSLDRTFAILCDVTLSVFGRQFQMDSFIITANAIYIIEVKSLEGTITFHTGLKQLTQHNGEMLVGRKYPITQAENNAFLLSRWLQFQKLGGLPIYYFVAMADQNAVIHINGEEDPITKVVSYVEEIPIKLVKLDKRLANAKTENNQLKNQIVQSVLKNDEELQIDILEKLGVHMNEILPGVHCPTCNKLGMVRMRYTWHCSHCHSQSRTAHRKALLDFALIYGNEISNIQCQQFLNVGHNTAYSILKNTEGVTLNPNKRKWLLNIATLRKQKFTK